MRAQIVFDGRLDGGEAGVSDVLHDRHDAIAARKLRRSSTCFNSETGPKKSSVTRTVSDVAMAMMEPLKTIVTGFRPTGSDEHAPSAAAKRIAASPPKSSIVRKMKVSETVICPLNCGTRMATRELKISVRTASTQKLMPRRASGRGRAVDAKWLLPPNDHPM